MSSSIARSSLAAAAILIACAAAATDGQPTNAWTNGGASTTATADGKPAAAAAPAAMPYWQAPALPTAVIQGGAIPPGWQPQAVPYQGLGPDGQPITMYFAPTYVFTYQAGPPVLAQPTVNRPQARVAPQPATTGGWNYATSGAQPVPAGLPPGGYQQYRPVYQFPTDARALSGTPLVPPGPLPQQAPLPPQAWAAATPQQPPPAMYQQPYQQPPAMYQQPAYQSPVYGPPPNQWVSADPQAAAVPPPPADQWAAAAPFAAAGAAAGYAASQPAAPPVAAINSPTMAPVPPPQVPVQPASLAPPSSPVAPANIHRWRVVGVYDGDTITCLDENNQQQKVRLAEIDAPESGQDYGKVSREALAGMVFGRTVDVVDQGRDRYGRWVAQVSVGGLDVNRQMIASGNAWHYTTYSNDASLAAAQQQAQAQRLGLWAQQNPVPPWEYRKSGQ